MIFTLDILEESKITNYSILNCKMSDGKTMTIADVMTKSVISVDSTLNANGCKNDGRCKSRCNNCYGK